MQLQKGLFGHSAHVPVLIILQILFIILFGVFVVYNPETAKVGSPDGKGLEVYPMFQDVSVMIFIGFGFLMTFLKKYGLSAVSLTFLLGVMSVQWGTLVIGFFHLHHGKIELDLQKMLGAEFSAATILISFGVIIGKTSPLQLIAMVLLEIVLFVINEVIGRGIIGTVDAGDTIFVHLFGAYFGLACSFVLQDKRVSNHENQAARYNSDLFSMVGTIFLWIFWPSFNASTAVRGGPQHRAVLNTYYSLCACVVSSFAFSALTNSKKKFVMEHIQNATLAGGVAIGAAADMFVTPMGALIVGTVAGILSTIGFDYVTPFLNDKLRIHDTCGVHNLHGMPALFGAIVSMIVAATASEDNYTKTGVAEVFPVVLKEDNPDLGTKQLIGTVITLVIAIVGGALTGLILRLIGACQGLGETMDEYSSKVKLTFNSDENPGTPIPSAQLRVVHHDNLFNDNVFFEVNEEDNSQTLSSKQSNGTYPLN